MSEVARKILHDLKVVDLSGFAAGQIAARWLAEFGSETVRVAPPGGDADAVTAGWAVRNRSKSLVSLDLSSEGDRARLQSLLAGADVLIHDLDPVRSAANGLDAESLGSALPHLVTCSISAFPGAGSGAVLPPVDSLVLAHAGMLDEFMGLSRSEGPIYMRVPFATLGAARLAVVGVLARLIARRRDGAGGAVRTSLLQGALASMGCLWARGEESSFHAMSRTISRRSPADGGFGSRPYRCADGLWLQIVGVPDFLPLMAEVLDELGEPVPEAPEGLRGASFGYAGLSEEVKARALARRPRAQWLEALWAGDVPAFACLELGEVYADEQARLNGFAIRVNDPVRGPSWQPGAPCRTVPASEEKSPAPAKAGPLPEWPAQQGATRDAEPLRAPLDGIRVLDFGQFIAGPYSACVLADLGADVIKVEPPKGDGMRPPTKGLFRPAKSFAAANRGKRTIAVDLKDPDARPVIDALVAWADVVHHNVRLGAFRRLGLDYETLTASRPDLIYCHIDAYGAIGPRADWPGFDPLAQAASGWMVEAAGPDNPPFWLRNAYMDYHCGLSAAAATLLALYARLDTGLGQFCGASLLGECLQSIGEVTMDDAGHVSDRPRLDTDQTGLSPFDRLYRCEDSRWLAVIASTDREREALLSAFEVQAPELLEAAISRWPREYALTLLQEAGVPAAAAKQDQMDAFLDSGPDLVARYRSIDWGWLEQVGALWDFEDMPLALDLPPPAIGEHTTEICNELEIAQDLMERLVERGTLRDWRDEQRKESAAAKMPDLLERES